MTALAMRSEMSLSEKSFQAGSLQGSGQLFVKCLIFGSCSISEFWVVTSVG